MKQNSRYSRRFAELNELADEVLATKRYDQDAYISGEYIDNTLFLNWKVKARHLLVSVCGEDSQHFKTFKDIEDERSWTTNYGVFNHLRAVFDAAKDDFQGGYLASLRSIIEAELFSSEIEQAQELLASGYVTAAAVVAGVVLETTLRRLCDSDGISHGKLDKMNADLAKAGRYSLLVQKRITALADIRNNAAHGHPDKFTRDDVADMIEKIEAFVTDHV